MRERGANARIDEAQRPRFHWLFRRIRYPKWLRWKEFLSFRFDLIIQSPRWADTASRYHSFRFVFVQIRIFNWTISLARRFVFHSHEINNGFFIICIKSLGVGWQFTASTNKMHTKCVRVCAHKITWLSVNWRAEGTERNIYVIQFERRAIDDEARAMRERARICNCMQSGSMWTSEQISNTWTGINVTHSRVHNLFYLFISFLFDVVSFLSFICHLSVRWDACSGRSVG